MRKAILLLATPLLAAPIAAQGTFEGMIAMTVSGGGSDESMDMKVYTDGQKQAMVMTIPASGGQMAGMEMRIVLNPGTNQVTMLIPMPPGMPGGGKGMKMVHTMTGMEAEAGDEVSNVTIRELGTEQTIAGYECTDYEVVSDEGTVQLCMTDRLGRYLVPDMSNSSQSPEMAAWTRAFGNRPAFPLKASGEDFTLIVTEVRPGPVAASLLDENPDGYMPMPGMGG